MQDSNIKSYKEAVVTYAGKSNYIYIFTKRVFDIVSSLLGIILLSPLFIIIAIIIKKTSKGPVFFTHKRFGKNGKIINVYKFRTMVCNAESLIKLLPPDKRKEFEENFKIEDDPRITKIGKILRTTSLDELPQLVNILKGDMSVVGPRPIVTEELEKYGIYADKFLSVTPGLTGNWQANGRSDTTYDERVQLDMEYIDNRNILMDIIIILKTFSAVFRKRGAK